ncbi:cytochrome P450 [Mycena vitilis]|nr:cytochrome P450 [Mycena vitilis]
MDPLFASLTIASMILVYLGFHRRGGSQPVPPGPSTRPIIGNSFKLPSAEPWLTLLEWKKEYGNLVYLHGLGNRILVVNSLASVRELFENRWSLYSHRPMFIAAGELMGIDQSFTFMPYGDEWRECRKITHGTLNTTAVKKWHRAQEDIAVVMSKDILDRPQQIYSHIRLTASRIVLYVGYGFFAPDMQDPYIADNEETMDIIGKAMAPGAFLCDLIPALKYSPSWVPFQRQIKRSKEVIYRTVYKPYMDVKTQVESGTAPPSLSRDLLSSPRSDPRIDNRNAWSVSSMYGAGTETTAGTVQTFVLAMALHPTVQERAQTEIDNVIGLDRMPVISDMADLPFVRASIKETLRWHPPVPLGLPRRAAQDDFYDGFFIPKNTTVFPNIWAISRDTADPEKFNPDRFMGPDAPVDPFEYVFGFGRRICTGVYLAENSIFAMVSAILATFNISSIDGETLTPIFSPNHISGPEHFECSMTPRSDAKAGLIKQRAEEISMGAGWA